jgi:acyl carrier protein
MAKKAGTYIPARVVPGLSKITVRGLVEVLGVDEADIALDAQLHDDLGADSLDLVELAMFYEEQLGVEIADDILDRWGSIPLAQVEAEIRALGAKL